MIGRLAPSLYRDAEIWANKPGLDVRIATANLARLDVEGRGLARMALSSTRGNHRQSRGSTVKRVRGDLPDQWQNGLTPKIAEDKNEEQVNASRRTPSISRDFATCRTN